MLKSMEFIEILLSVSLFDDLSKIYVFIPNSDQNIPTFWIKLKKIHMYCYKPMH